MKRRRTVTAALAIMMLGLCGASSHAAVEDEAYGRTPPRLSFLDGEVSFWRPGSEDWAPARVNLPIAPGDALYTGSAANVELQIGTLAFVRAGELTQLSLSNQDNDFVQFSVTTGHLAVDVRSQPNGRVIEIDTPGAAVMIDRPGYYRFRITDDRTTIIARRGGRATVTPANGEPRVLTGSAQITIDARERVSVNDAPDSDVWDQWNYDRSDEIADASSNRYVPPGVYGAESMERYGTWRNVPTYGWVWAPTVAPGWVPYSAGSWIWDSYYGWTWVDDAPWGWAPAHYGRWVYVNNYWGWAPGPVVVRPFYAPAVVAWFGGGIGVSVGIGVPAVSWVALGWGEPLYPWWGPVGFYGSACWYGWGGPRWRHHHGHHDDDDDDYGHGHKGGHGKGRGRGRDGDRHGPEQYQNAKEHNAILRTDRNRFGRGPVSGERVPSQQLTSLAPANRELPKPERASFAPQQGAARRPPESAMAKPVVATRQAHDPTSELQAAGVSSATTAARRPARVVSAPPQSAARSARNAGVDDSIDRSPISAPRRDSGLSAPGQAPASGPRQRSSGVGAGQPMDDDQPASAPRSSARVPDAPRSAPRQRERSREGVGSSPANNPPPVQGSREPRNAARSAERGQPPAPPMSAPRVERPEGGAHNTSRSTYEPPQPQSAPREAARDSDRAPMSAPRSVPRSEPNSAPPSSGGSGYSGPGSGSRSSGSYGGSAPSSAPRSYGGAGSGPSNAPRSYGGGMGSGPSSAPRSYGGGSGSPGGGASSAPRSSGGVSSGGGARQGGGGGGGGVGHGSRD